MGTITTWKGHTSRDWGAGNGKAGLILHLSDLWCAGREQVEFNAPEDIRAYLTANPDVTKVMFGAAWMPRRAVAVGKVTDAQLRRLFNYRPRPERCNPAPVAEFPELDAEEILTW